jgi:hypothetical protein
MINKLKKLAEEFHLKFNKDWFNFLGISKKENILIEYMWMCPDPIYKKYGITPYERAKNIENFISSSDFKECLNRFGGQIINKGTFQKYFPNWIKNIENLELRKIYFNIYEKIYSKLGKSSRIALLTKSDNLSEKEKLKTFVLFHEWIHILINENKINFPHQIKEGWQYNEGLVTYFQEFAGNRLNKLEEGVKYWKKYNYQKQYYIYAIKFRELLKFTNSPKERKDKIMNLKRSLSK